MISDQAHRTHRSRPHLCGLFRFKLDSDPLLLQGFGLILQLANLHLFARPRLPGVLTVPAASEVSREPGTGGEIRI